MLTRKNKDWACQILKDLSEFGINQTLSEIRLTKKETWKSMIRSKAIENALKYLNSTRGSKSQAYKELKMSNFLTSHSEVPIETAKFIAKIQSHMVESIKCIFKVITLCVINAKLANVIKLICYTAQSYLEVIN